MNRAALRRVPVIVAAALSIVTLGAHDFGHAGEPAPTGTARVQSLLGNLPLYFVENRGQEDPRVAYYVPGRNIQTYFTADGVTFAFASPRPPRPRRAALTPEPITRERWALKLDFVSARPVMPRGQDVTPTIFSYFKGPESEWKTGLRTYASVVYPDLWPGIDLVYGGSNGRLKYAFHVKPGADPAQIRLAYRGATAVVLDRGRLEVSTPLGGFTDDRPYAYQDVDGRRVEVAMRYAKAHGEHAYGFEVADYDRALPLVLDPSVIVYAGYIGGTGDDEANAIALDSAGNAYVAGNTASTTPSFPARVGPDLTYSDDTDAFVAKVKADGTGLVYAGYIGGSLRDEAKGIAVDASGNAYVTGTTSSDQQHGFPRKTGPSLAHGGGFNDAFVAKVKADGTALVYSGYIGGAGDDQAFAIAVDSGGNAYVAGSTTSNETSFPVTQGPGLTFTPGGGSPPDAFVAKVKPDGSGLVYAGYIGGDGEDRALGIAVDSTGHAYVAGSTNSRDNFPVAVGPGLDYISISGTGFVAKVKPDGTGLVYAGYVGGSQIDIVTAIAVDAAGNAYVAGDTQSGPNSFPVKNGPGLVRSGNDDAFVAKVKADGTGFVYAGYIAGEFADGANAIAVDSAGNAYVAGVTDSDEHSFPVKAGPGLHRNGFPDAFVAKVNPDGTGLVWAGYLGGGNQQEARGIAVDSAGNVYVAGVTSSDETTFPVTVGPGLTYQGGDFGKDAFVVKLSGKPDLVELLVTPFSPFVLNQKPGDSFTVKDAVTNRGLGTAPSSKVRYYLSTDTAKSASDIRLTGTRSVPSLNPGDTSFPSPAMTVTIPSTTPFGTYHVLACADDLQAATEVDETNNCVASAGTVRVSLPDLRETSVTNPPASANAGQNFTVTDTVQNFGTVPAGATTTRYYLSTDALAKTRRLTGTRAIGALTNGQTSSGQVVVTIPPTTASGSYFLLACANDTNSINELDTTNNCLASTSRITVSGTGTFELSPTAATVLPDQLVVYTFRWITPTVWRDLASLELRFIGASDGKAIFWVRWDQASNTFVLVDTDGTATGRPAAPGSSEILQTGNAVLRLNQTSVVPGGPTAPDVTLTLAMTFKSEAAGQVYRDYRVEVSASDDAGRTEGFARGGTLRVQRTATPSTTLAGSVTGIGSGTDNASIRLQGQFTAAETVALNEATLTLNSLLDEVSATGELTRGAGGATVLPLTLTARAGGKTTDAIYESPSGARPIVWAEIKTRDASTGLTEFYIKVDRATIPVGPALCSGGSSPTTRLRTSFTVQAAGASAGVDVTLPWRCLGSELKTP